MPDESMLQTKSITDFEIKDADRGEVMAIVSTFNVVDRDGDVVLPGAIKDGTTVKLSAYGHDVVLEGKPPVGRGVIRVKGDRAILESQYFMSTARGREAFAQVKEMGGDSEWSVGFLKNVRTARMTEEWRAKGAQRLISGMDTIEASPVFIGANQFTETLGVKEAADDEQALAIAAAQAEQERAIVEAQAEQNRAILKAVAEQMAALKAAQEAEAAVAAKAAADAEAARIAANAEVERSRIADLATKEYERFQRTMRRQVA